MNGQCWAVFAQLIVLCALTFQVVAVHVAGKTGYSSPALGVLPDSSNIAIATINDVRETDISERGKGEENIQGSAESLRRDRREIYGEDDRIDLDDYLTRRFPFTSLVFISTGCTGVLVSRHHVLTAAHCLHSNGSYFRNIKVGVPIPKSKRKVPAWVQILDLPEERWPATIFFNFFDTSNAVVPDAWIRRSPDAHMSDFGLITLKQCIKKSYLKVR